jgi:16S rRNA (guanine(966)-N(2))-methyltransferase RsmD
MIADANFLDLCAGSGAVGIEALSRGAARATFIDESGRMCALIKSNLELCAVTREEATVKQMTAEGYLKLCLKDSRTQPFDVIFFDPPYSDDYSAVLQLIGSEVTPLLTSTGKLIVEHHHKNQLPDSVGSIIRSRTVKQGESALSFYQTSASSL